MALHIDASAERNFWTISPYNDVRTWLLGVRFVACGGALSTYADFLGVALDSTSQVEITVSRNGSSSSLIGDTNLTAKTGILSAGDIIAVSAGKKSLLSANPSCIVFDWIFKTPAGYGLFLSGYDATSGKSHDYITVSHKADMSGLDYVNLAILGDRVFMP